MTSSPHSSTVRAGRLLTSAPSGVQLPLRRQEGITQGDKDFLAGAAWALGVLASAFDHPNLAAMIANEGNYTCKDFESAGVEEADLVLFRPELKRIEAQRAQRRRRRGS